jgi:GTP-binding protein LepA
VTDAKTPTTNMVKGFEDVKPMVFAGIYPVDTEDYEDLKLYGKLQLNDASLVFQKVLL